MDGIVIKAVDWMKWGWLIVQLHEACFSEDKPLVPEGGYWWIAYDNGIPVAFAGLTESSQWDDTGYLCRSGVIPAYRGRRLQKRLIKVRVAKAKKLGWVAVVTDTRQNPASANSLIGCGFKMYDPRSPWSFDDACYWRLDFRGKQ